MRASVLKRYPELKEDDVVFHYDSDTNITTLFLWNSDKPKPTMEEVIQWIEEDKANEPIHIDPIEQVIKRVEATEEAILALMDMGMI